MGSVREEGRQVNGKGILAEAMAAGQAALLAAASGHINQRLSEVATAVVGRDFHVRRDKWAGEGEIDGQCQRCHTRDNWRFSRNGYRARSLLTVLGRRLSGSQRATSSSGRTLQASYPGGAGHLAASGAFGHPGLDGGRQ